MGRPARGRATIVVVDMHAIYSSNTMTPYMYVYIGYVIVDASSGAYTHTMMS
jgi:hypothetical protein